MTSEYIQGLSIGRLEAHEATCRSEGSVEVVLPSGDLVSLGHDVFARQRERLQPEVESQLELVSQLISSEAKQLLGGLDLGQVSGGP